MPSEWKDLSSNEKHARLLELALDRTREILSLPLPDPSDDSIKANRLRALVLSASDRPAPAKQRAVLQIRLMVQRSKARHFPTSTSIGRIIGSSA
jgi:hypothetical protein